MVLGMSYGDLFLVFGAAAAILGRKDLVMIARVAGRLSGRSIGYVKLLRSQLDNVADKTQAREMHQELQKTWAQIDEIRHEVRNISNLNLGPLNQRLMDNPPRLASDVGDSMLEKREEKLPPIKHSTKDYRVKESGLTNLQSQATTYAKFAEVTLHSGSVNSNGIEKLKEEVDYITVLPISAELAGILPDRKESPQGSDLILEAIIEAKVARDAQDFFSRPENQIPPQ